MIRGNGALLLAGTSKGLFVFRSNSRRMKWKMTGPYFPGAAVYHTIFDRNSGNVFASVKKNQFGCLVAISRDAGDTWNYSPSPPSFPRKYGLSVENIWQLHASSDGTIYAGVQPACLFKSEDQGISWKVNAALARHETRSKWQPGFGGLCFHTVITHKDPWKMHVAISAVGTLFTCDGGRSWEFRNKGVRADFLTEKYPVFGQCVHKIAVTEDGTLFQQNHCGVYRSDDEGEQWSDISSGPPSDFGFPVATARVGREDIVYVAPLRGGDCRPPPGDQFSVWKSHDRGGTWDRIADGLPRISYYNVLRDGMKTDNMDRSFIYFGTTTGQIYASECGEELWFKVADGLPPILSVEACEY